MKKILLLLGIFLTSIMLMSCSGSKYYTYEKGLYELYFMSGNFSSSSFEYFTIELFENGKIIIKIKGKYTMYADEFKAVGKFSIEDEKITVNINIDGEEFTEVYDYKNGEIHMWNVKDPENNISFSAKFRRYPLSS
jgi:hypothetical protein